MAAFQGGHNKADVTVGGSLSGSAEGTVAEKMRGLTMPAFERVIIGCAEVGNGPGNATSR